MMGYTGETGGRRRIAPSPALATVVPVSELTSARVAPRSLRPSLMLSHPQLVEHAELYAPPFFSENTSWTTHLCVFHCPFLIANTRITYTRLPLPNATSQVSLTFPYNCCTFSHGLQAGRQLQAEPRYEKPSRRGSVSVLGDPSDNLLQPRE